MMKWPFCTYVYESGARPSDWRYIIRLDGWDFKVSPDQAVELAQQIRDAIETCKPQSHPVLNHEGQKITFLRFGRKITFSFSSPIHSTDGTGEGLTIGEAKDFLHELVKFAESCRA